MVPKADIGREIEFLIDTGADGTVIGGPDALQIGLTPNDIDSEIDFIEGESTGIGGTTTTLTVDTPGAIGFQDRSKQLDRTSIHVEFIEQIEILPSCQISLLGRDILDRFDVEFRQSEGEVELVRHNYGEGMYFVFSFDSDGSPGGVLEPFEDMAE